MPSSKPVREETPLQRILEYVPKKFETGVSDQALGYLDTRKRMENDFRMAETIRIQTGVNKIEELSVADAVEQKTLDKLKEVQESAYQEAYSLGLEEGRKEALQKTSEEIDQNLQIFAHLVANIENLKSELIKHNETHIVKLLLHMAQRLASHEVQVNQEAIVDIMRQAILSAQAEEEITVQVSVSQFDFLETLKKETKRELEFLKKVKLVPNETINPGGCIIETNYGVIDARFEERVSKLWQNFSENLYKVKPKIGAA